MIMEYNFGSYPTMITPYDKNGKIDFENVKRYVRWYAENNCHGIFSVCQSSEIFFLDEDERTELNRTVYEEAQKVARETGKRMTIVSSGHVSEKLEDQARELNRIYDSGTDALIFITNRLDLNNEGDDVWLSNAEKLLNRREIRVAFPSPPQPAMREDCIPASFPCGSHPWRWHCHWWKR